MSISNIDLSTFKQNFDSLQANKEQYGEVHTDFVLINDMLKLIPLKYYKNPNLKWLDPCCGRGYFTMILYKKLFESLQGIIPDQQKRHDHIICNMIYMIEINPIYFTLLKTLFGEKSNIYCKDFLENTQKFDIIIGNPPFNCRGLIKVPTNNQLNKKFDGKSCWQSFIKQAFSSLNPKGLLLFITPSIWMKNDHPMFSYMLQYSIKKIHTMTNTETNKLFHGQAQTPTCYFLVSNIKKTNTTVSIYDKSIKKYVQYNTLISKSLYFSSLPLFAISIIQKIQPFVIKYGYLKVKKTSMRPDYKGLDISSYKTEQYPYPNISTCRLNGLNPRLIINYSNKKCVYADQPKIVLAHKMYGFPYYDKEGKYGISNRDNYVILNKKDEDLIQLTQFLSSKFILTLFEATRYRMKYLERYIFEMIPDITYISDFPKTISDISISTFFKLNKMERNLIDTYHKKKYNINSLKF